MFSQNLEIVTRHLSHMFHGRIMIGKSVSTLNSLWYRVSINFGTCMNNQEKIVSLVVPEISPILLTLEYSYYKHQEIRISLYLKMFQLRTLCDTSIIVLILE